MSHPEEKKCSRGSKSRWLPRVMFMTILALGILKVAVVVGSFLLHTEEKTSVLSPSEVLAEDQQTKEGDNATSGGAISESSNRPAPPMTPEMLAFLQKKETEIKQREVYLEKLEKEVQDKLTELLDLQKNVETAQKEIEAFKTERNEEQNSSLRSLSKIYGSMKAKEAGKLLENLDDDLVVKLIQSMQFEQAADILSNMDPKKAAKISMALSAR